MAKKEKNNGEITFSSMIEIRKKYLPKSFEKQKSEKPKDARELGIIWAKESMEKIRKVKLN